MSRTGIAALERRALCDELSRVGPDAPTLCEGWTTADLAAHVFVRERRPIAAPGIMLGGPFGALTAREMSRAFERHGYAGLVARIRSGPPLAIRPIDELVNPLEFFVHREDVRRAAPGSEPLEDPRLDDALWGSLARAARLFSRKLKSTGLELEGRDGSRLVARPAEPRAVVSGGAQELVLFLFGRSSVARVTITGPPEAVEAVRAADFSV